MTNDSADRERDSYRDHWAVELDVEKCSLCEVCAHRCPTGAIRLERTDEALALYFRHGECTGCTADTSCEAICPEEAIKVIKLDAPACRGEDVLLIESKLVRCGYCGELFAPNKKLESLGKKGLGHEVEKTLCPLCRRKLLVVKLIDEKMVPGKHAEYRSTKDILRRARFRLFQDDDES
ncbi:MAG: 4Fe-4S dicluster domain-containing protein [Candidatus Hydrogenedentota bacterium]|nr:MAG: 4Fe-4S dicluster domain-containing protein [Candidatus Hydrogenedentota bacterium]